MVHKGAVFFPVCFLVAWRFRLVKNKALGKFGSSKRWLAHYLEFLYKLPSPLIDHKCIFLPFLQSKEIFQRLIAPL
jgi:hypothetical protein